MLMIYYVVNENQYVDYRTIKEKTNRSRTFLDQYLDKIEVRKMYYGNRLLYNLEDLKSTEIIRYFQ